MYIYISNGQFLKIDLVHCCVELNHCVLVLFPCHVSTLISLHVYLVVQFDLH